MKNLYVILIIAGIGVLLSIQNASQPSTSSPEPSIEALPPIKNNAPPCIQMYDAIRKYAAQENIPLKYAFGVAYAETHYQGPMHWKYNPGLTSGAGAVGPMQIMPQYGKKYVKGKIATREDFRTNIDLNVMVSMKMLRHLKDVYGDWKLVFGAYNTGRPCVNGYALSVYNFNLKTSK